MIKTLLLLALLIVRPADAGDGQDAGRALMNQWVPGYDQLAPMQQAGWNALFIHRMIGDFSPQYQAKQDRLIQDWMNKNPGRTAQDLQLPAPLSDAAKATLINDLAARNGQGSGDATGTASGQKSLDQILSETGPLLSTYLPKTASAPPQPQAGPSETGTPNSSDSSPTTQTTGSAGSPGTAQDPINVPDTPVNPGDAVPGGRPDNAFTGKAPGSTGGGSGTGGPGGSIGAGGGNAPAQTRSMPVENGAPSGELAAAAGTKSMASLKNKDAFGPDKRDDLDGAPSNRGPGRSGQRGPAGAGGPGAASGAYPGSPSAAPAMDSRWPQSSIARPTTLAFAARSATTSNPGSTVSSPRPSGSALSGAQTSGGPSGGSSSAQNPSLGSSGLSLPDDGKENAKNGQQDKPQDLTEDEKKELAEIQQLLKEAAENGSLDPSSIEESLAKSLVGGQTSLAMAELQSRIEDILRLSGSELTMQEKQEVYALAGRLGLSDAVAEKLVAAVQHGRLPSPQSARRPMMRWQGFLLWLYGLWGKHSGLLLLGLALIGLICAAAANYLARDS